MITLDNYWRSQDVYYEYKRDIAGTGNRSTSTNSLYCAVIQYLLKRGYGDESLRLLHRYDMIRQYDNVQLLCSHHLLQNNRLHLVNHVHMYLPLFSAGLNTWRTWHSTRGPHTSQIIMYTPVSIATVATVKLWPINLLYVYIVTKVRLRFYPYISAE